MVEACLPGTGGMVPLPNRWLTCCWIEHQGSAVLIDCGEGTQIALKEAGCKLSRLDALLITHFHADHIAGLPGLLLTLGNSGKTTPLTIVGPVGLEAVVSALTCIAPALPFPLALYETDGGSGKIKAGAAGIAWLPLSHHIPCLGYSVTYERKPVFNPQKAAALGIPKPLYKALHDGEPVMLEDGRLITPELVLDGQREPVKICYCTDTRPVASMIDFATGADLFISEGMYGTEDMRGKMADKMHMLFSDSAAIAKAAKVRQLWLTHFSPALTDPEEQLDEARRIFPETIAAYDGIRATVVKK
jgi:ribonuclease Z